MNSGWTLYMYEMRKLLRRRSIWIVMAVCALLLSFTVLFGQAGRYYGDAKTLGECYELFFEERRAKETLSGREIDQALLEEMSAAYRKMPEELLSQGNKKTRESLAYVGAYTEIFELVRFWLGMDFRSAVDWEPSEENLYGARRRMAEIYCRELGFSEEQKGFWLEGESRIPAPVKYVYHDAYYMFMVVQPMVWFCLTPVLVMGVSGMFAEERMRGTDQVALACAKGRGCLYWAKLWAGITLAALCAALMNAVVAASAFCIYGTGGFEAAVQFFYPYYAYPMTMGQACLILYGIFLLIAMMDSVFVMVLSELSGSSRAALILAMGILGLGMAATMLFYDRRYGMPSFYFLLPMPFLWHEAIFDIHPVVLWGQCFAVWQVIPAVQLFYGILAAAAGRFAYVRHQVRGV